MSQKITAVANFCTFYWVVLGLLSLLSYVLPIEWISPRLQTSMLYTFGCFNLLGLSVMLCSSVNSMVTTITQLEILLFLRETIVLILALLLSFFVWYQISSEGLSLWLIASMAFSSMLVLCTYRAWLTSSELDD